MKTVTSKSTKIDNLAKNFFFPLYLLIFSLTGVYKGVDLTDSGYSLGHYVFFPVIESGFILNTYLGNVTGYLFTMLPFGSYMLAMKIYTTLIVSTTAIIAYRFFITKIPPLIAFISVMAALGLCWCPTVIIYNYLTYLFFLLGAILLFRGLAGQKPLCLVAAGVFLGMNIFVRNPNLLQVALVLCIWYYGFIRRKPFKKVVNETLLFGGGYLAAVVVMVIVVMIHYGKDAPLLMVQNLMSIADSSVLYTPASMLQAIAAAYLGGFKWLLYLAVCVLPGIPFMMLQLNKLSRNKISEEKITFYKKIVYCIGIVLLFYALSRIGMYNFRYYQKESAYQWAIIFLIVSLINMGFMLYSKTVDVHWKLIAAIGIVIILVTPLGSNNNVWPIINNLFFIAPITIWRVWHFTMYGRAVLSLSTPHGATMSVHLFPLKAMQLAIVIAFVVQSLGVGSFYVFREGYQGEARNSIVVGNEILRGMRTTDDNAALLSELGVFMAQDQAIQDLDLILYGDIPALSYYLNRPTAISHAWPDLDSYPAATFGSELSDIANAVEKGERVPPLVIIRADMREFLSIPIKRIFLDNYKQQLGYSEVFRNRRFVVYYSSGVEL